jgi:hypothetical protein
MPLAGLANKWLGGPVTRSGVAPRRMVNPFLVLRHHRQPVRAINGSGRWIINKTEDRQHAPLGGSGGANAQFSWCRTVIFIRRGRRCSGRGNAERLT